MCDRDQTQVFCMHSQCSGPLLISIAWVLTFYSSVFGHTITHNLCSIFSVIKWHLQFYFALGSHKYGVIAQDWNKMGRIS